MRILHVVPELYPYLKTGGLGDVAAALPTAERALGLDARLLIPGYGSVLAGARGLAPLASLPLVLPGGGEGRLLRGETAAGVPLYVLAAPALYERPGGPYGDEAGRDWPDNAVRFAALALAGATLAAGEGDAAFRADVAHVHDWPGGLLPVYLAERAADGARPGVVVTIHNLAFQGLFPAETRGLLGLPERVFSPEGAEFHGRLGFLKAGLYFADRIATVSPTYAREILTPGFGCGLDGLLRARADRLTGILNGIDTALWNPAEDVHLPARFDARGLDARAENAAAVRRELGLAPSKGPLFAFVGRLTEQKGIDLVLAALPELAAEGAQLAVLGSGAPEIQAALEGAAVRHADDVAVRLAFDEGLAHRLVGGADVVLVPSRFEPCGLVQMYAQRYGAAPLARRTGGLADTVVDADAGEDEATGFIFDEPTAEALLAACERAVGLWREKPARWRALQQAGMTRDWSWRRPALRYAEVYGAATGERGER